MDISTRTEDHRLLQESLALVAPRADELVASFYDQLFAEHPTVRSLFPPVMDQQREKLLKAIIALVTHYDQPDQLMPALTSMGRNHVRYGAEMGHYAAVGKILLETLSRFAGDAWTPEVEGAWTRMYTFAAGAMMQGAEAAKAEEQAEELAMAGASSTTGRRWWWRRRAA
jgi:methyl-accepting chemotaxis protein